MKEFEAEKLKKVTKYLSLRLKKKKHKDKIKRRSMNWINIKQLTCKLSKTLKISKNGLKKLEKHLLNCLQKFLKHY